MASIKTQTRSHLALLIGKKLSIARRAADMRGLHFGNVSVEEKGSRGEFGLHIQCPWRIDGPDGIVTGRTDLWEPADPEKEIDWDTWDYDEDENLQDRRIGELLGSYDSNTRSFVNETADLVVREIETDDLGGATLLLSGGYRIVIFPAGSEGEDWRFLNNSTHEHFVVSGGKVTEQK